MCVTVCSMFGVFPIAEEQWPELFSKGEPSTAAYQAVSRAAQNTQDKEEEEERKRIENERYSLCVCVL